MLLMMQKSQDGYVFQAFGFFKFTMENYLLVTLDTYLITFKDYFCMLF